jgi:Phosphorylase superfamily
MTTTMDPSFVPYRIAAAYLLEILEKATVPLPSVGIICGSGLSELSNAMSAANTLTVKYSSIPGFPAHCTVAGHKGEVVFGMLSGVPTMCFRGRFHSYEGHDMKTVVLPVNVMRCLGVKICIVTNAAGGLNPEYRVGDVIAVSDHLAIPLLAGRVRAIHTCSHVDTVVWFGWQTSRFVTVALGNRIRWWDRTITRWGRDSLLPAMRTRNRFALPQSARRMRWGSTS